MDKRGDRVNSSLRLLGVLFAGMLFFGCAALHTDTSDVTSDTAVLAAAAAPEDETKIVSVDMISTPDESSIPAVTETPEPMPISTPTSTPTPTPTPTSTPTPTPIPTPIPTDTVVTIGAVGDIMMPSGILIDTEIEKDKFVFDKLFAPMRDLFESVDWMCGNLEVPIAGKEAGYSTRKNEKTGAIYFNAPDSLLATLRLCGVDMLTTANNHCIDKGIDGLRRTVEMLEQEELVHTGTYRSVEDHETVCIVNINGIKVGFVAATRLVNTKGISYSKEDLAFSVCRLTDDDKLSQDVIREIQRLKEAGAEFVIVFAHWDYETDDPTATITKSLAKQLLAVGADCIIGSHPHRIKEAAFVTVDREDGPYTGAVFYSLGNFTANGEFINSVGLFVRITLKKDAMSGKVELIEAAYLPTIVRRRKNIGAPAFAVFPAYKDPSYISGLEDQLSESEMKDLLQARVLAAKRLGDAEGFCLIDGE